MKHTQTILKLLALEVVGNTKDALALLSQDYVMTWMYKGRDAIFPFVAVDKNNTQSLEEVYVYPEREYKIYTILESGDTAMAEIVESYYDPEAKVTYTTPIAFVWTFDNEGKVLTGKHYCDPQISKENEISEKSHVLKENLERVFVAEPVYVITKGNAQEYMENSN